MMGDLYGWLWSSALFSYSFPPLSSSPSLVLLLFAHLGVFLSSLIDFIFGVISLRVISCDQNFNFWFVPLSLFLLLFFFSFPILLRSTSPSTFPPFSYSYPLFPVIVVVWWWGKVFTFACGLHGGCFTERGSIG